MSRKFNKLTAIIAISSAAAFAGTAALFAKFKIHKKKSLVSKEPAATGPRDVDIDKLSFDEINNDTPRKYVAIHINDRKPAQDREDISQL